MPSRPPYSFWVLTKAFAFWTGWASQASLSLPTSRDTKPGAFPMLRKAKKFFKTPKGLLILILSGLIALAAPGQGWGTVLPGVLSAVALSGVIDIIILRFRKNLWEFPSGAVLTAMITAMVLRAQEPWYVVAITSAFAVVSKYIVRT